MLLPLFLFFAASIFRQGAADAIVRDFSDVLLEDANDIDDGQDSIGEDQEEIIVNGASDLFIPCLKNYSAH
jgi:hypothetical protein